MDKEMVVAVLKVVYGLLVVAGYGGYKGSS